MHVAVLGINYKSADLGIREIFAKASMRCFGAEGLYATQFGCVLLATCNRTEIYFSASNLAEAHSQFLAWLRQEIAQPFEHHVYSYFGEDCFTHLASVTAGFDSVVLAETEIQRQVKMAYEFALLRHTLPSTIHYLFQKCLKLGKWIRTRSPLLLSQHSLEALIFHLMKSVSPRGRVFFLGNSEINRKIITYFKAKGVHDIALCTRAPRSAEEFAKEHDLKLMNWDHLHSWPEWETVICGTNHHDYLIREESVTDSCKTRLILDLSLPRNAEPSLNRHPQITLKNIEELGLLIQKKQEEYVEHVADAQKEIREAAQRQLMLFYNKEKKGVPCASSSVSS